MTPDPGPIPRLKLSHVGKRFGPNVALADADFALAAGEVHGLVGQNGSGKSTLIKILAGYHSPDAGGRLEVDGTRLRLPPHPRDLVDAGISFVHQDLGLLDHLNVTENICVGAAERTRMLAPIDQGRQHDAALQVLARLGVKIDVNSPVGRLPPAERAIVAIARGMLRQKVGQGVIVLDESTRTLPPDSLGEIHAVIRRIADEGGSVVLVSHNLEEVLAVTDRVTVLRDGRVVASGLQTTSVDERDLAQLMLGYYLGGDEMARRPPSASTRLRVSALSADLVDDVSFDVAEGEIIGLTGLAGSGFEDIPYLLTGVAPCRSGQLGLGDATVDLTKASVVGMRRLGIALVPARRERDGLAFDMSVEDNITLPRVTDNGRALFIGNRWRREEVSSVIESLGIRPPDPLRAVRTLSGGNQQKVLLGKWLAGNPKVLILHEPTQAVDVGARRDILETICRVASSGVSIVIASVEAGDLAAICHRVLIFERGHIKSSVATSVRDEIIDEIYSGHINRPVTAISHKGA